MSQSHEFPNITFAHPKRKIRGTFVITYSTKPKEESKHEDGANAASSSTAAMHFNYVQKNQPTSMEIKGSEIVEAQWIQTWDAYTLKLTTSRATVRFTGFQQSNYTHFDQLFKNLDIDLQKQQLATKGANIGYLNVDKHSMSFLIDEKLAFEVPLSSVEQTVIQGKNELGFEFKQDESLVNLGEQLYEMRVWVPDTLADDENDMDDGDAAEQTAAMRFQKELLSKDEMKESFTEPIAKFEDVMLAVPRGRYTIEMYDQHIRIHNKTYNYKISFEKGKKKPEKGITRMLLFDNPDQQQHLFILELKPPIRQGRTAYPYMIAQFNNTDDLEVKLNLKQEEIDALNATVERNIIKPEMIGQTWDVISRVFNGVTGCAVHVPQQYPRDFAPSKSAAIRCSLKAQDGYLFVLDSSFFFVKKPPTYIKYSNIDSIEFERVNLSSGGSKTFDMRVNLKHQVDLSVGSDKGGYGFTSINQADYQPLKAWLQGKKGLKCITHEDSTGSNMSSSRNEDAGDTMYKAMLEEERPGEDADSDEEDSDFESSGSESGGSGSDSESGSGSGNDSDMAEEVDEDDKGNVKTAKNKKSKKAKAASDSDEEGGKTKKKASRKIPGVKGKSSAFIFFSNEHRPKIIEELTASTGEKPGLPEVGRELGKRWKELTDDQKKPYNELAEKDAQRFENDKANAPEDSEGSSKATKAKGQKRQKEKSAPTAFVLFCKQFRLDHNAELKAAGTFGDQQKLLGQKWKELSAADKKPYEEQHAQLAAEMQDSSPDRKPAAKRQKKARRQDDSSSSDRENQEPVEVAAAPRPLKLKFAGSDSGSSQVKSEFEGSQSSVKSE